MINKSTMHKVMVSVMALSVFFLLGMRSAKTREKLPWMKLQEAQAAAKKQNKPILIDLYTDWCGWCKVMDKQTYANKNVAAYINEKFYPVKLNAEMKQAIVF